MNVALDFTGDMISFSYFDGNDVVTEILRNTIGFRTPDLFRNDGAILALMHVTKDMIEFTIGSTVSDAILAVPLYCSYAERERIQKAAAACGVNIKRMIKGTWASMFHLFQTLSQDKKKITVCNVHSDYAEFLISDVDGDVLEALGSTVIKYGRDSTPEDRDKLKQIIQSEFKALYSDLQLPHGEATHEVYVSFDESADPVRGLFLETLISCFGTEPVIYEKDAAKGAFYHLMKMESFERDPGRKVFSVDCSMEGISVSSGVVDNLQEVFRRNTPLPAQRMVDLMVSSDNVICFYAGNYRNREYDEPIGTCRIPDAYRGQAIHVKITLNDNGIVEYSVLDASRQIIYPRQFLK